MPKRRKRGRPGKTVRMRRLCGSSPWNVSHPWSRSQGSGRMGVCCGKAARRGNSNRASIAPNLRKRGKVCQDFGASCELPHDGPPTRRTRRRWNGRCESGTAIPRTEATGDRAVKRPSGTRDRVIRRARGGGPPSRLTFPCPCGDESMRRVSGNAARHAAAATMIGVAVAGLFAWFVWSECVIDVPNEHVAVLIRKIGRDLPNDMEVAPGPEYKGVQAELLKEGRYFRNPFEWDWEIHKQVQVPPGKVGVVISLTGDDLPAGEFLARKNDDGTWTKGILPDVLRPGRYALNPYMYELELHDAVTIPAGYRGVVTHLAGPLPKVPNQLLSQPGERGVQPQTLDAQTHFVNPYVVRISLVDTRSQRFNLAETKDMGFPSKDGFWVSLDGSIEFRVDPERAAEVFVTYNDTSNGDRVDEEIIRKIIMPNARSFCRLEGSNSPGRDFISGETRTKFQQAFEEAMRQACEPLGIQVIQALITRIRPPEQIAEPVRRRELALQEEKKFQQQILQQQEEKKLAEEKALVKQKQALVSIDREIITLLTQAEQEQKVSVTEANQRKGVAEFRLQAAADEAAADLARGSAEADVIRFENAADAAGWRKAVAAFRGNGAAYARYVLLQKTAAAYRRIMANTADSPLMEIFRSFVETDAAEAGAARSVRSSAQSGR
ncbi:MAG: band 7 protein [Planctomycetota bacterium]|nr:MAG: band 7 protein [Planctomycetota bacterium]